MTHDNEEPSAASAGSKPLTFGSLFAGIGGFDLGLERAGMVCKWQVEIDDYATRVLEKHWPTVRRWNDVRTFPPEGDWNVDVICGGFPCQDISVAGKGAGLAGARSGLWYEYARIVGELRPRYVIVENVAALLTRGMDAVLGTLSSLGYDAEWHVIPASAVGAPHRRERAWIVAYANCGRLHRVGTDAGDGGALSTQGQKREFRGGDSGHDVADAEGVSGWAGLCEGGPQQDGDKSCDGGRHAADAHRPRRKQQRRPEPASAKQPAAECGGWWSAEPDVGRVAHGVPSRVDRLRCLGNAVVPQVVEVIGRAIVARESV